MFPKDLFKHLCMLPKDEMFDHQEVQGLPYHTLTRQDVPFPPRVDFLSSENSPINVLFWENQLKYFVSPNFCLQKKHQNTLTIASETVYSFFFFHKFLKAVGHPTLQRLLDFEPPDL